MWREQVPWWVPEARLTPWLRDLAAGVGGGEASVQGRFVLGLTAS